MSNSKETSADTYPIVARVSMQQWDRRAKPFRVVFYVPFGRRYWEVRSVVSTFATEQEARAALASPPKGCKKRTLDVATDTPDGSDWYFRSLPSSDTGAK